MDRTGGLWISSLMVVCLMISWNTGNGDLGTVFKMTPDKDLFLIKGSQLNMNCTVNNSSYDVHKIGIGLGCKSNGTVYNCTQIPDQWLERVAEDTSERTLMVQKPNISYKDNGTYTCYYGIPPQWQHAKLVHVGEIPSKPENISCVSENFQYLKCSASVRPTGIPMKWVLNYTTDGEGKVASCTAISNNIRCEDIIGYPYQPYTIFVVGSNDNYNVSVKATFKVENNYSIVKPNPVRDLHVQLTNISSEAIVIWNPPQLFAMDMELVYRVQLKESAQKWSNSKIYNLTKTLGDPTSYTLTSLLTNLIPHMDYSVAVSCKPVKAQGDLYWSNETVDFFITNIDIPGSSVELLPGSFQYLPANDSDVFLTLYWKNPSDRESHGDINTYKLQITETRTVHYAVGNETRYGNADILALALLSTESVSVNQEVVLSEEFAGDRENVSLELALNRSSVYTVQVWAGNDAGYADFPVNISIPPFNVVIVERDKKRGQSLVSWTDGYLHTENVSIVTVYSCEGYPHGKLMFCKDINWLRTHFGDKPIWMSAPESYQFAVALETEEGLSGGVFWQTHDFLYDREIPTYVVNADPNNHTILYISVTNGSPSSGGKPEKYGIAVRKQEGKHEEKCPQGDAPLRQQVNFSESKLLLTGLEPDTEYMICMDASNLKGRSWFGEPFFIRTSSKPGPEDNQLTLYVVISIVCAIAVLMIGVGLCYWCKKKIESMKLNNRIADVEVVVDPVITKDYRQTDEMRTNLLDTTSIETHNLSDSGEGFGQDRRWSLISNSSGYSHGNVKRRNSSSRLSGYLIVDGDTYELSMKGETVSLIDDDDDDDEQGDTNEYFDPTERKNVYHEIDDGNEFHNPGNSYIVEAEAAHGKNDLKNTVPSLEVCKLPLDGENVGKDESMNIAPPVFGKDNVDANIDTNIYVDKNDYVPNHQIKHNTAKDEYLLKENHQSNEPVALKSKPVANKDIDLYHQNDGSSLSGSEDSTKSFTADTSKSFLQSKTFVPDQDDSPRQNDTSGVEAGIDGYNLSEVATESNNTDKKDCLDVEVADGSGDGEYRIEQWDNSDIDDMEYRNDIYCNPDSISIEEEYLNSECSVPENDATKVDTYEKTEDSITLAKTLKLHSGKENGRKIVSDDIDLCSLKGLNHYSSGLRNMAAKTPRILDIEDQFSTAESGQSSDTYVCARINQSV